jgi:uncharacterized protein
MPDASGQRYPSIMLLDILRQRRDELLALSMRCGASNLRVFGSVARREERPDSDVDFLVELPVGYDLFGQRLALAEGLAELTGRLVEVIPEHELNRHIRARVLSEAVPL